MQEQLHISFSWVPAQCSPLLFELGCAGGLFSIIAVNYWHWSNFWEPWMSSELLLGYNLLLSLVLSGQVSPLLLHQQKTRGGPNPWCSQGWDEAGPGPAR